MFKVVLNDGQNEMPKDDVFYIIAKEGVYLKKKLGVMESLAPVKNISILESVTTMAKMHITKIPGKWIAKVIGFFQAVYEEYRSEAIILLFYNEETGKYKIVPPVQQVAGASCDYDKGLTIEGMTMIGTIHSHGNMSAFHSGVDDADEEHFDGLHITLGDLDEEFPSVSSSIVANGHRVMVDPYEYIDDLVLMAETNEVDNKAVRTIYKIQDGKLVEDTESAPKFAYSYRRFDRRYDVLVAPHDRIFNKKWLKMVSKGTYTYKSWGGHGYSSYGYRGYTGWGQHYDIGAWNKLGTVQHVKGTRVSPLNVGSGNVSPLKFPPHTQEGEFVPCATCVHRESKLLNEMESEEFTDDIYQCNQCGELVKDDGSKGTILCSNCLTDEHLVLVDDDVLLNSYTPSDEFDHLFEKDKPAESDYIKCRGCSSRFHAPDEHAICPFCYTEVIKEVSSEELLESQFEKDSGAFLDSEKEEANNAALEESQQTGKPIEKIKEPGSSFIPIPEKTNMSLKDMFKRVFSKEKNSD